MVLGMIKDLYFVIGIYNIPLLNDSAAYSRGLLKNLQYFKCCDFLNKMLKILIIELSGHFDTPSEESFFKIIFIFTHPLSITNQPSI